MAQNDNEMIMDGIIAYALAKRYTQQFLGTGIISVAVVDIGGTVNLDFSMSDGSHVHTPIEGVLTPQQKIDVVRAIPLLNKMLENTNGRLQYNEKTLLTEEDITLDQTKELVKLLNIITIGSDGKGKINNIKFDVDVDNDIMANGKKILYSENIGFIVKSKYSDLTVPKVDTIAYVLQEEIKGEDTFKAGFYVYDQSIVPSSWRYIKNTSDFNLKKWQTGVEYKINEYVVYDYRIYKCLTGHTSNVFDTDKTNWELYVGNNFSFKLWGTGENYFKDEYVVYNYKLYQAKVDALGEVTFDEAKYALIIGGGEGLTPEQLILINKIPSLESNLNLTKNNLSYHEQNKNNPHEVDISGLKDTNIANLLDGQVLSYDSTSGEWVNKTITVAENGKIKLNASSALDYLENYIDNSTIQVENNKLVVKTLDGLTLSVTEINGLKTKIDSISSAGMRYTGTVADKATLDTLTSVTSGETKIVLADESQSGKRMTYVYNGATWEALGEFSVQIRDFTVNPIDLSTEVTGKLSQANMDLTGLVKTTDLADYMDKTTYDSDNDGIVDKSKIAETLEIVKSMSPLHVIGTDENGNLSSLPMSLKDMRYESKNRQLDYGLFTISKDVDITPTTIIPIDTKLSGNLTILDNSVTLFKNRTYRIMAWTRSEKKVTETNAALEIINSTTGEILGIASSPSFSNPISIAFIEKLAEDVKIKIQSRTATSPKLISNQFVLLIEEVGYARDESLEQITKLNIKSGDSVTVNSDVDLTDGKIIESCFKFVRGEENIVKILKTFDNTQSESFYYDKDKIEFSDGMSIKKKYEINSKINSENYYETEVIDKDILFELVNIEEGGIL